MTNKYYDIIVSASLTVETPLLVSEGNDDYIDNAIAPCLSADKTPYIPGSTIKGSISEAASRLPIDEFAWIFGNSTLDDNDGNAGNVIFLDAKYSSINVNFLPQLVTRNSIERTTGSSKDGALFELSLTPKGSHFDLKFKIEEAPQEKLEVFCSLLESWGASCRNLGSGKNQNFGQFTVAINSVNAISSKQQTDWLLEMATASKQSRVDSINRENITKDINIESYNVDFDNEVTMDLSLIPISPLFFGTGKAPAKIKGESETIIKPLLNDEGYLVLPATSLRGAIRAQAERIVATLGGLSYSDAPPVEELFGNETRKSRLKLTDFTATTRDYTPQVQTMLAIDRFSGGVSTNFKAPEENHQTTTPSRGIDRFTDGDKSGATYNVERHNVHELKGQLSFSKDLLNKAEYSAELALLLFIIRDLLDAEISIGAYKAKGFGKVRAALKLPGWPDEVSNWKEFCEVWSSQQLPDMKNLASAFEDKYYLRKE